MKGLKFLILPVLAAFLLPLSGVNAQTSYFDLDTTYSLDEEYQGRNLETLTTYEDTQAIEDLILGMGVFFVVMIILIVALSIPIYIYTSIALMTTGKKLGYENSWFAWIPVLNTVMKYQLGGLSPWFVVINFIPMAFATMSVPLIFLGENIDLLRMVSQNLVTGITSIATAVLMVIAYMRISEKRGYDKYLGLLTLVPIANLVLQGILAWGKGNEEA